MKRKLTILSIVLVLLFAGLTSVASPALAGSKRVSRGQAMSLLHAWTTGRLAVSTNNGVGAVQFDANFFDVAIRPFQEIGKHYCAEDHQLAAIAWINVTDDNYQDAKASLDTVTQDFLIDDAAFDSIRTPVRRAALSTSDAEVVHGFSEGVILAPGDLSVGEHTFDLPVYFDGILVGSFGTTFYIDAAGTGVCQ